MYYSLCSYFSGFVREVDVNKKDKEEIQEMYLLIKQNPLKDHDFLLHVTQRYATKSPFKMLYMYILNMLAFYIHHYIFVKIKACVSKA